MRKIFVFVGPSGSGKTTLAQLLMSEFKDIKPVPSHTTRPRRETEICGVDYFFISKDQFRQMKRRKEFLAFSKVYGNDYGTSTDLVLAQMRKGNDVLLILDYKGLQDALGVFPDAVSIFIAPPNEATLEKRLKSRSTESYEVMQHRLATAAEELKNARNLDHLVVNDKVKNAMRELRRIVKSSRK